MNWALLAAARRLVTDANRPPPVSSRLPPGPMSGKQTWTAKGQQSTVSGVVEDHARIMHSVEASVRRVQQPAASSDRNPRKRSIVCVVAGGLRAKPALTTTRARPWRRSQGTHTQGWAVISSGAVPRHTQGWARQIVEWGRLVSMLRAKPMAGPVGATPIGMAPSTARLRAQEVAGTQGEDE